MSDNKLPVLADLISENEIEHAYKNDALNALLNSNPPASWVKNHPFIKKDIIVNGQKQTVPYQYIPIDKIEFLIRKIFRVFQIEITGQGTAFNGVWVTVRIHYLHPILNKMMFHDGIGAMQLQTARGTSPADLANINNGALSMAFPAAKTIAVKDACDHFGKLFGSDINRNDTLGFSMDVKIEEKFKSNREKLEGS